MSTELNKKIPTQRWIHIIPAAMIVYIVAMMDRTNIGFAMAAGMDKDIGMSTTMSGLIAGIFFIGYLFLQVPGGRIAERGSAKKFIAWSIVAWGGLAILSGLAQNVTQLIIIRFLLGVAEGGVYPALLTIISHWFPNEERGRANALFTMNMPIAAVITGPLSGWIASTYSWRHVFIIEGAIAFLLIFIWLPLIKDRPSDAKWISKEEKDFIETSLRREQEAIRGKEARKVSFDEIVKNSDVWKLVAIYFTSSAGLYGFSLWLPTLLKNLTHSGMTGVGLLSTIPYLAAIAGLYVFGMLSDKSMNRKRYIATPMGGFAISLLLSVQFGGNIVISFTFMVACGLFLYCTAPTFWTIPPILFDSDTAASSCGFINALGNIGGFLGPYIVGLFTTLYSSTVGIYSLAFMLVIGFVLTMTLPAKTEGPNHNIDK